MTRREKQIAHIEENLERFKAHAGDDVEQYFADLATKHDDRNWLYEGLCADLDLEPRQEALYNDEP